MRALIVEDEKDLNRLLRIALEAEGYCVDCCFNGDEGVLYATSTSYDIIIMDIMMPVLDGFSAVKKMRDVGVLSPVLFLSAKSDVESRVKGLETGGDYYLTKPFQMDELLAVVRAMLRKYSDNKTNILSISDLTMNLSTKEVFRGETKIDLTVKEFALLEYMLRNKGVALSREMIENHLWNYDYEGGTNVVDVYIGYLRKKLDHPPYEKLIHTVWGVGWRLATANQN